MTDYSLAACQASGVDPDIFFPLFKRGTQQGKPEHYRAMVICSGCPIREECLEDNLTAQVGIFGGTVPATRKRMALERGIPWPRKDYDEIAVERAVAGDKAPFRLTKAEKYEVVRRMIEEGRSAQDILANTGMSTTTYRAIMDEISRSAA